MMSLEVENHMKRNESLHDLRVIAQKTRVESVIRIVYFALGFLALVCFTLALAKSGYVHYEDREMIALVLDSSLWARAASWLFLGTIVSLLALVITRLVRPRTKSIPWRTRALAVLYVPLLSVLAFIVHVVIYLVS